jgi:alanyl-tRNA synthetase
MGDQFGKNYSTELCGGTHVNRTGDIGFFKILGESSVSAGVRRIEALTGSAAVGHILEQSNILRDAAKALKTSTNEIPARLEGLLEEKRKFEREASDLRRKLATGSSRGNLPSKHIDGIRFVSNKVEDAKAGELKSMIDDLKKTGSGIYALISINEGKASLVVGVSPDLTDRFNAVTLVRRGVEVLGGKGGGGRSDMAQGGGPDGLKADAALLAIEEGLSSQA